MVEVLTGGLHQAMCGALSAPSGRSHSRSQTRYGGGRSACSTVTSASVRAASTSFSVATANNS